MADNQLISLNQKVVLVTGGSRGIGAAIAHACARAEARIVIAARKQDGVDALARQIRDAGGNAIGIAAHMGKPADIEALFDAAGDIDVLVNNAATNPYFGPMMDISEAAFDKTVQVNIKGYFWAARAFVKRLCSRNATGNIINIASIAGRGAAAAQGVYGMTKAAVISMTQTLAVELGPSGIRVNAIAPGLIDTRFAAALTTNPAIGDVLKRRTPVGRFGMPQDVAGAAVFLASDAAAFITGEVLVVDGGLTVGPMSAQE